ncbi:serine hydrolase domain-containing protein [Ekhidna sp.]
MFSSLMFSQAQNVDNSVLQRIIEKSNQTHSDALIIQKAGQVIVEKGTDNPIYIASAGKSLVSLGVGKLLSEGFLDSLDQPIHYFFPEWKQGDKSLITVKMLLNHTSGLQNHQNASIELEPAPDYKVDNIIRLALAAELDDKPGEVVSYNNKAVALLGGVIEKASELRMDQFFEKYFFEPMNISDVDWIRDRSGNPTAHGSFIIKPSDLLKFGTLMLNEGTYLDNRLISKEWIDLSFQQGQPDVPMWGLLWWRLPAYEHRVIDGETLINWKKRGASDELIESIQPIKGQVFENKYVFFDKLKEILGEDWSGVLQKNNVAGLHSSKRIFSDEITAYYANGYRGNFLVIIPEKQIVAVRCADPEGFNYQTDFYSDFAAMVSKL